MQTQTGQAINARTFGATVFHGFTYGQPCFGAGSPPPVLNDYALVSTGTQWIDTGWFPTNRTFAIEVEFEQTEALQPDKGVIGSYNGQGLAVGGGTNYAGKLYSWTPVSRLSANAAAPVMTTRQTVLGDFNGTTNVKTMTINGFVSSAAYPDTLAQIQSGNNTLKLFCNGETGRADRRIIGRLYHCKIWSDDILVRDFVPVNFGSTRYSATPAPSHCMWDAVTQTYFQNAGTGVFSVLEIPPIGWTFSVDTRRNVIGDATFIIPFAAEAHTQNLAIDWGDGTQQTIAQGTAMTQALLTRTYATPGIYNITVTGSNNTIPTPNFYNNYRTVNNNNRKPTTIGTLPLCVTDTGVAQTSMLSCFRGCTGITVVGTPFANNPQVTNFSAVFYECSGLLATGNPFTGNLGCSNFSNSYRDCTSITATGTPFNNNAVVVNFSNCFNGCTGLTSPGLPFENNPLVTNFSGCFAGCTNLTTTGTPFVNNTSTTNFSTCYNGCTKAQIMPDVFGTAYSTRFNGVAGVVNFTNCFTRTTFTGVNGTAPSMHLFAFQQVPTKTQCFSGAGNNTTTCGAIYTTLQSNGWVT